MKKVFLCILLLFSEAMKAEIWKFTHFKDVQSTIRKDFLVTLQQLFKISIFIETGTGGGITTERAAQVFEQVHSIEIQPDVFLVAKKRLQEYANVSLYNEDSAKGLRTIIKSLNPNQKSLFFLDAHYNGVENGKGEKNTPVMEELDAIFSSQLSDPVIIIDDARTFRSKEEQEYDFRLYGCDQVFGYPHIKEVIGHIKQRKPHYHVYVYGDLIIGYAEDLKVSPLIKFMTEDMVSNSIIHYCIDEARAKVPHDVFPEEITAISFITDSKILYGPATYHIFFEMWQHFLSDLDAK